MFAVTLTNVTVRWELQAVLIICSNTNASLKLLPKKASTGGVGTGNDRFTIWYSEIFEEEGNIIIIYGDFEALAEFRNILKK